LSQNGIEFPYFKNALSFKFGTLDYLRSKGYRFSWKLEKADKDWVIPSDNRSSVSYSTLLPGSYTFFVKSSSPEGIMNNDPAKFSFRILPPWWQTWWFRTLIIFICIVIIYWIFNLRTQKLLALQRIEIEKNLALEGERSRIARDMHDDLGSGLSAIHLLSNYLKENVEHKYPEFITEINKIIQSSGDLNQSVREIIWTINTKDDTLHSLVMFVIKYCNELNEKTKTNIEVNAPDPIPNFQITGDQRKHLFLCVKESINNALKHSKATAIEISFSLTNQNNMSIHIIDNGIGFDADKSENLKQGNGLINIKQRMKEIGGNVDISSNSNGTQITLDIPLPFSLS
jgi:signal transduction histidine kinase